MILAQDDSPVEDLLQRKSYQQRAYYNLLRNLCQSWPELKNWKLSHALTVAPKTPGKAAYKHENTYI